MSSKETLGPAITYREYKFKDAFPFIYMPSSQPAEKIEFIHFHNCIEIAYCEKGTMLWNLENKNFTVSAGSILLIPPFYTHASIFPFENEGEIMCHYLFFDPSKLLAPFYPNGLPGNLLWYQYNDFPKILNNTSEIHPLIVHIIEKYHSGTQYTPLSIMGLVEALMVELYRQYKDIAILPTKNSNIPLLFPAIRYLDKECAQVIDSNYLAELCGISHAQFIHKFHAAFQQTPKQYVRTVRIHKACLLLTSTETTILDIALQTGFQSLTSLN